MMPAISSGSEIDFEAEARLDPVIQFPHAISRNPIAPLTVFLTGATGFSGAYLLDELLQRTEATVYCLVRASDPREAAQKLILHLQSYGLWQEESANRIRPVAGDLEQPRFGLSDSCFRDLAAQTEVIYHCAGWINMVMPYARLRPANVTGTEEILRFAGTLTTKPLHFLSSIAVFYSDAHSQVGVLRETDIPRYHPSLKGGYSKSKWVSDRLVAAAQARGLPACHYRPVRIMGHSQTGAIHDMGDLLPQLLKCSILLGKYPALDIEITLAPVDYVTQAMAALAGHEKSWGRAFHFFNPAPIAWRRLMGILQSLGYALKEVDYDQWWQELARGTRQETAHSAANRSTFARLRLALSAPHYLFYNRPPMDSSQTAEGLAGTGIACPPIDHALIATYVAYWQRSGYLPIPGKPTLGQKNLC